VQKSQVGSYTLQDQGDTTEVTYKLTVDIAMPMLGMFKRKAEKMIMDSALKELKKRVEATA
jgi:carbon monoxide dehydrogenase subunit G